MSQLHDLVGNPTTSIAGISPKPLLQELGKDKEVLVAVLKQLSHPHVQHYRDRPIVEIQHQIVIMANTWKDTYPGEQKPALVDVILKAVYDLNSDEHRTSRRKILGGVCLEEDLTAPFENHLKNEGYVVKREVPIDPCRADLVGHKKEWWDERWMVAVELKNAPTECERLKDQIPAYHPAVDEVRVVMTPECMIGHVLHEGALCTPQKVIQRFKKDRVSLILYNATAETSHKLFGGQPSINNKKYDALWTYLQKSVEQVA